MRWSKGGLAAIALVCTIATSVAIPERQLTVYTMRTSYSLPVLDRDGKQYVGVKDLLAPLGASAPHLKGKEWRLEINQAELRLVPGSVKAIIRGQQANLIDKVLVEDGRILVPLDSALLLLSRLLNTAVDFHQPSRRIFVGNNVTHFQPQFTNGERPLLVLSFSQPVIADANREEDHGVLFTHTDKTTLYFRKDPVVSDVNKLQFGNGAIQSLIFTEENGTASIT